MRNLGRAALLACLLTGITTTQADAASTARGAAAERALVSAARALDGCRGRTARPCVTQQRRLQHAAARAHVARPAAAKAAPTLRAAARTLTWNPGRSVIVAAKLGKSTAYTVARGTSFKPLGAPGRTVRYRVRSTLVGSAWSPPRSVTFPKPPAPAGAPAPAPTPAVAAMSVALKPAVLAGLVTALALAVSPDPVTVAAPAPAAPAPSGPRMGINLGWGKGWSLGLAQQLGAKTVRIEVDIATPVAELAPLVASYADAGMQINLLAGFTGRIPNAGEVANIAAWANAFGPGGAFWLARSGQAAIAIDRIEFGNESSGSWQYAEAEGVEDWAHSPQYARIAEGYGRAFRDAAVAIEAANPRVDLLAVANSPGRWPAWMDGMFRAVPGLARHVDGWVLHPYGPDWALESDDALAQARSHGASDAIPIYVTETGLASDDGRCLDDNYGWDPCMTYAEAGEALTSSVESMVAKWGSRLKEIDLYAAADLEAPGASQGRENYFGGLTNTQGRKGAFTDAVEALLRR